jgi:hypothetical protein
MTDIEKGWEAFFIGVQDVPASYRKTEIKFTPPPLLVQGRDEMTDVL